MNTAAVGELVAGTRWVKIDVSYLRNTKISSLSRDAVLLHLASILWTAEEMKDGAIPRHICRDLAADVGLDRRRIGAKVSELVDAGLWEPNGEGWHVHDFQTFNKQALRANVEAERKRWRDAKRS